MERETESLAFKRTKPGLIFFWRNENGPSGNNFGKKENLFPLFDFVCNQNKLNLLKYQKITKDRVPGTKIA